MALQGILASFLREPLLDWQREAVAIQGSREAGNTPTANDIGQHSTRKIDATRKKLEGCHPSDVMLGELEASLIYPPDALDAWWRPHACLACCTD